MKSHLLNISAGLVFFSVCLSIVGTRMSKLLNEMRDDLLAIERILDERNAEIAKLRSRLNDSDAACRTHADTIAFQNATITAKDREIAGLKRDQWGPRNSAWKGPDATYKAFHCRVKALRGSPQLCEECGASGPGRSYDWASLTKNYNDPKDYKRMCRSCHFKMDKVIENIRKMRPAGGQESQ